MGESGLISSVGFILKCIDLVAFVRPPPLKWDVRGLRFGRNVAFDLFIMTAWNKCVCVMNCLDICVVIDCLLFSCIVFYFLHGLN